MNASELIERNKNKLFYINQMIESHEKLDKQFGGHQELITEYRHKKEEAESVIRELSRTRIRVTATEPPTREDGGSGDHGQYVMARAKGNYWEEIQLIYVAENPDEYPHWTCVPQLPEVTPL